MTIKIPSPTRSGKLMKRIFISGTIRASTAKAIINKTKAANMGAASLRLAVNIAELAWITPLVKIDSVGVLPAGNAS